MDVFDDYELPPVPIIPAPVVSEVPTAEASIADVPDAAGQPIGGADDGGLPPAAVRTGALHLHQWLLGHAELVVAVVAGSLALIIVYAAVRAYRRRLIGRNVRALLLEPRWDNLAEALRRTPEGLVSRQLAADVLSRLESECDGLAQRFRTDALCVAQRASVPFRVGRAGAGESPREEASPAEKVDVLDVRATISECRSCATNVEAVLLALAETVGLTRRTGRTQVSEAVSLATEYRRADAALAGLAKVQRELESVLANAEEAAWRAITVVDESTEDAIRRLEDALALLLALGTGSEPIRARRESRASASQRAMRVSRVLSVDVVQRSLEASGTAPDDLCTLLRKRSTRLKDLSTAAQALNRAIAEGEFWFDVAMGDPTVSESAPSTLVALDPDGKGEETLRVAAALAASGTGVRAGQLTLIDAGRAEDGDGAYVRSVAAKSGEQGELDAAKVVEQLKARASRLDSARGAYNDVAKEAGQYFKPDGEDFIDAAVALRGKLLGAASRGALVRKLLRSKAEATALAVLSEPRGFGFAESWQALPLYGGQGGGALALALGNPSVSLAIAGKQKSACDPWSPEGGDDGFDAPLFEPQVESQLVAMMHGGAVLLRTIVDASALMWARDERKNRLDDKRNYQQLIAHEINTSRLVDGGKDVAASMVRLINENAERLAQKTEAARAKDVLEAKERDAHIEGKATAERVQAEYARTAAALSVRFRTAFLACLALTALVVLVDQAPRLGDALFSLRSRLDWLAALLPFCSITAPVSGTAGSSWLPSWLPTQVVPSAWTCGARWAMVGVLLLLFGGSAVAVVGLAMQVLTTAAGVWGGTAVTGAALLLAVLAVRQTLRDLFPAALLAAPLFLGAPHTGLAWAALALLPPPPSVEAEVDLVRRRMALPNATAQPPPTHLSRLRAILSSSLLLRAAVISTLAALYILLALFAGLYTSRSAPREQGLEGAPAWLYAPMCGAGWALKGVARLSPSGLALVARLTACAGAGAGVGLGRLGADLLSHVIAHNLS